MKCWVFVLLMISSVAQANDIHVEVTRDRDNTYIFNMRFVARASTPRVQAIITDYANLTQLNPLIKQSRILPYDDATVTRVELVTEGCMLFYCKKIVRVEEARILNDASVETKFIPELSDFKSGHTRWIFTPDGHNTIVNYKASMVPDFWLPPFVGPYMLKKQLHSQLEYTANKINSLLLARGK